MKRSILPTILAATLVLGTTLTASAQSPGSSPGLDSLKLDPKWKKQTLTGRVVNGKGVVSYQGKRVWRGRVKQGLRVASKMVSGFKGKYTDDTELAAAWDGEKLLWENVKGAAQELQPEFSKMEKQLEEARKLLEKDAE